MKVNGHNICDTLKAIRKQIADANEIEYSPEECHFKGECNGTCPKCEQDVRNLEHELKHRQMAGKTIKVAGIAAGFVAMTACSDGKPQRSISADTLTDNTVEIKEPTPRDCRLVGDISLNHKGYSADEEEILIDGEVSNGTSTVEVTRQANSKEKSAGTPAKKSKQSKTAIIQPAITSDSTENSKIFGAMEEKASFPGGSDACLKYIADNLRYPDNCINGVLTGLVIVSFTVNEDGNLSDIKVERTLDHMLDEEVIRVVKSMPKWKPAKLNGKAVKSKYTIPVNFRVSELDK